MELIEILAILILLGVLGAVALLLLLLNRTKNAPETAVLPGLDESVMNDLTARVTESVLAEMPAVMRADVTEPLLRAEREGQSTQRTELQRELRETRTELSGTMQSTMERLGQSLRESQRESAEALKESQRQSSEALRVSQQQSSDALRASQRQSSEALMEAQKQAAEQQGARLTEFGNANRELMTNLTDSERTLMAELTAAQSRHFAEQDKRIKEMETALHALLGERMEGFNATVSRRLEEVERQFREFREQSAVAQGELKRTMEERLTAMQTRNAEQLEQMRATVDEKLQKTLDERISQSFKAVSERLGDVYKGLGEMQALAGDVGDLKKVMSGVKTRGIYGEIRLGAIMEEIFTPEQYEQNAVTRPGSACRVEFALRLPGEGDRPVLLPIDAKFPADAYHHLADAYESGDPSLIEAAKTELKNRLKACAKDIRDKYIEPPYTTTFGILFLPFEGLYAEVVRMGILDTLQQEYRVSIAGPTTLSALLNSLQMGFRTLAIQKRTGEVWEVLGAVKTEFGKFEKVLQSAKDRLDKTGEDLEKLIGTRTRQINRKLKDVSELSIEDSARHFETIDSGPADGEE